MDDTANSVKVMFDCIIAKNEFYQKVHNAYVKNLAFAYEVKQKPDIDWIDTKNIDNRRFEVYHTRLCNIFCVPQLF